jgi:hypothetical protein
VPDIPENAQQLNQAGASAVPRPAMSVPPVPSVPRNAFEGIQSATVLKPGDRVLLVVRDGWNRERVDRAARLLAERFPEVEFTFTDRVEDVVVKPSEESSE